MTLLALPLLALAVAAAIQGWNVAGIQTQLSGSLFSLWQGGAQDGLRPSLALPVEIALLFGAGFIAIALATRLRLYWAGLFVVAVLVAALETSWLLFRTHHWLIDTATPALGLVLCFVACGIAEGIRTWERRTRLRVAFSDSLDPVTLRMLARRPALIRMDGDTRMVTCLVCGVRNVAALAQRHHDDPGPAQAACRHRVPDRKEEQFEHDRGPPGPGVPTPAR